MGMSKEWAAPKLSVSAGPSFVQGATIRDVFDPTANWDELLFRCIFLKETFLKTKQKQSQKYPVRILVKFPLSLWINLERIDILKNVVSS